MFLKNQVSLQLLVMVTIHDCQYYITQLQTAIQSQSDVNVIIKEPHFAILQSPLGVYGREVISDSNMAS